MGFRVFIKSITLIWMLATCLSSQTFRDSILSITDSPVSTRQARLDSILAVVSAFPLVEQDTLAMYVYIGSARGVTVAGDANGWNPMDSPLQRIEGTEFWYRTEVYESDARLEYKFIIDGENWILDPLNPLTTTGGFGPNSELRMAAYQEPPELQIDPDIPRGQLAEFNLQSNYLDSERKIIIYLPPSYESTDRTYPTVYFHDGSDYLNLGWADRVLDYLISKEVICPIVGIFIDPVNRNPEYAGKHREKYSHFIVKELVPWVDEHFRTIPDRSNRAVMGASNGGNISLWLTARYPDIFANVASQSSNIQKDIFRRFRSGKPQNVRIYLDLGTYDIPIIRQLVRDFVPMLQSGGYVHCYREYPEGHSWGLWRAHIDDALKMFFACDSGS